MNKFPPFLLPALLLCVPSHAQQISEDYFQTPNASDLGRYGDTKVSFYTGQAKIEISLYSFDIGGCDFPISLVYDTSGVLVNKFPGWTDYDYDIYGRLTREYENYEHMLRIHTYNFKK